MLGFWIYIMSDTLIFAVLFATFGVLSHSFAGGPTAREILELPTVAVNTAMLLISSITCGFAMLAMEKGRPEPHAPLAGRHRHLRRDLRRASNCTSSPA